MHGLEGAAQVIAALLHGACTLHTSDTVPDAAQVAGSFEIGELDVSSCDCRLCQGHRATSPLKGASPLCLAEHYEGKVRRLRLVLTKRGCLSQGEQNQFLNHTHSLHGSGLLFGHAADGLANPDWLIVSDTSHPGAWRLLHTVSKAGGSRFTVGSTVRYPPGKCDVANKARLYQFEALHKIYFYVFFHEYGRHVGGVPRSSMKGKETQHDEGEKNTSNPKPNKHQPNKNPKHKSQRPNPPHLKVFPLYFPVVNHRICMLSFIFITILINRNMAIFIVSEVRVKALLAPSLQTHVRQIP